MGGRQHGEPFRVSSCRWFVDQTEHRIRKFRIRDDVGRPPLCCPGTMFVGHALATQRAARKKKKDLGIALI
jgi:hypothetical protein